MGIKVEDTDNIDLSLFERSNFELSEWEQWNIGTVKNRKKIVLGFRKKTLGVVFKTIGFMMSPDDAIRMGETLVSAGVNAKSASLMDKAKLKGKTFIE